MLKHQVLGTIGGRDEWRYITAIIEQFGKGL